MKLPCFLFCLFIYKGFVEGEWKSKERAVVLSYVELLVDGLPVAVRALSLGL
jgi:hypothetical protein